MSVTRDAHGLRLKLLGTTPKEFTFSEDMVTVGRDASNMVVLSDSRVSGMHGELVMRSGRYYYRDLGSTNGSLVRRGGRDFVVDRHNYPEVELRVGDMLLLGDISQPVSLEILEVFRPPSRTRTTDIWQRSIRNAGDLGTALVTNPLTSRKVLRQLFAVLRELATMRSREEATQRMLAFTMEVFRGATIAGVYRLDDKGACTLETLRTQDASPSIPSGSVFQTLFSSVFEEELSVVLEDAPGLKRAFGKTEARLRTAMASPLLVQGKLSGVVFVASPLGLTQFDLDLLTVLSHEVSVVLENLHLIERLSEAEAKLRSENTYLKEVLKREEVSVKIIGESVSLRRALSQVEVVARTNTTVLLLGETGTGKEVFARYLHEAGARRDNLFAAVNCGALAETLLESELFGHKKGAFTGAFADHQGLFEVADGGTLFLDEVGDVSPSLQVKLLRVLENGQFTPVGAVQQMQVDVRIIAATNKNLELEVKEGRFREDLYYRINVFPLRLPPLRERVGDIPLLAEFFLQHFNLRLGKSVKGFSASCLERLRAYTWPGNVRELQNEMERAVLLSDDDQEVLPEVLSERISGMLELPVTIGPLKETMARLEEQYILRALQEHKNNRTHTAKTLGISRQALTVKLSRYGLVASK